MAIKKDEGSTLFLFLVLVSEGSVLFWQCLMSFFIFAVNFFVVNGIFGGNRARLGFVQYILVVGVFVWVLTFFKNGCSFTSSEV